MNELIQNPDLNGGSFVLPGNNDSCIILLHGFTATTVEVKPLAEYLNHQGGFQVFAPLLPGHGTNPADLNNVTWKDWRNEIITVYQEASQNFKNVYVGGESMGGVLACLLASEFKEIKKLVLFSPAIKVDNLGLSRFVRFFKKYIPKRTGNPTKHQEKFPWQGYKVHPTIGAYQMLKLQKITRRKLNSIFQPVLIFQGKLDKTIATDSTQIVYNHIQSKQKELVVLDNSGHTIILDQEFDFVARKTLDFLISK
jgi:carboxylesterase